MRSRKTVVALIIKRHSIFYSILFSRVALTFSATCINLNIDFGKYNSGSFPWGEREIRDKIAVENSAYAHNDCPVRFYERHTGKKKKNFPRSWHGFRAIMIFRRSSHVRRLSCAREVNMRISAD